MAALPCRPCREAPRVVHVATGLCAWPERTRSHGNVAETHNPARSFDGPEAVGYN